MPLRGRVRQLAKTSYTRLPPRAQRAALRGYTRFRGSLTGLGHPLLSVVMPVYNVESYLGEAVDSVLSQSYRRIELILVDDGSTDTSGQLCDEIARRDRRVRVIHKANAGLGAARNTGIQAARGKYLAFIDSDDYVLPGAYAIMMASLQKSGSDLATGNVHRQRGKNVYQAWNQSRSHLVDRTAITLTDLPELLFDTVAWNKIYRTKFWKTHVKTFPVDKLYEDILPIFSAFLNATSIDVIARPVYIWRLRDEGDSITQRLLEPRNIGDRFEMIDQVDAMIRERGLQDTLGDRLLLKIIEGDLWIYVREMAGAGEETTERILQVVKRYFPSVSEDVCLMIPPERRVAYWLLQHDRVADVPLFRRWYETVRSAPPLVHRDGRLLLGVAGCPVPLEGLPDAFLDMAAEAEGIANVTSVAWTGPTTVTVSGYAYTKLVSDGSQDIALVATEQGSGKTVTLPTERTRSVEASRHAGDVTSAHDRDGYRCAIDVEALHAAGPDGADRAEWSFAARITDDDVVRVVELNKIWRGGSAVVVGARVLAGRTLALVKTDVGPPLRIRFEPAGVLAESMQIEGDRVTLRLDAASGGVTGVRFSTGGAQVAVVAERAADGAFTAQLPPPTGGTPLTTWHVYANIGLRQLPVTAPAGFAAGSQPNVAGLRAIATRQGRAAVQVLRPTAVLDSARCTDDGDIEVAGSMFGVSGDLELGIGPGTGAPERWHRAEVHDGRFRAVMTPVRADFTGVIRPLSSGGYQICARRLTDGGTPDVVHALLSDQAAASLPATYLTDTLKIKLVRRAGDRLGADISAPVADEALGRYAQTSMIARHGTTPRDVEDAVFFTVDLGSNASDSELAIHQELRRRGSSLPLYWGVEDLSVPVPEGGIPIIKRSDEWFAKLNRSRYIVNNYGAVWGLTKDPEQRYLQTWHGTPYKYIGVSEARHRNSPNSRLEQIAKESADWDALVSPSPYFSALAAPEFLFNGTILETGYPRNDRLVSATPDERAALRSLFGIPSGGKVLLYAPTYREGQRHGWRAALYDGLDISRLLAQLGDDWYVLLRGHSFNARDDHADRSTGRLIDVTRHHDINDLYLASDALVTDYSSVMFDYAVTGKPMAFFTPDLKKYVAARGVYFDLAEQAPGPLTEDVAHLAEHLRDLHALADEFRSNYAAFREKFAPWDDGKAAVRVVDAFFD